MLMTLVFGKKPFIIVHVKVGVFATVIQEPHVLVIPELRTVNQELRVIVIPEQYPVIVFQEHYREVVLVMPTAVVVRVDLALIVVIVTQEHLLVTVFQEHRMGTHVNVILAYLMLFCVIARQERSVPVDVIYEIFVIVYQDLWVRHVVVM